MKKFGVIFTLVIFVGVFNLSYGQIQINWNVVQPIYQVPSFIDRFPLLAWLLQLFPPAAPPSIPEPPSNENQATRTQFPYTVGLVLDFFDGIGFCGGSLISQTTVLTAAHCLDGSFQGVAILGANEIQNISEVGQERYNINDFRLHPGWHSNRLSDDIGFIILPQIIIFNQYIQPIRLLNTRQTLSSFANQQGTLSGWGTSLFDNHPGISPTLRFGTSHVITNSQCRIFFPTIIESPQICSIGLEARPCPGDSGSPYVIHEADNQPTLIGLVSFLSGMGCESRRAAVYTRIGIYLTYLSQNTDAQVNQDFPF